jgi:hypothetical protein
MMTKPPTPKRGAFPTPKEVLDEAPRYNPDASDSTDDRKEEETDSSSDSRGREDHQDGAKDEPREPKRQ